MDVCEDLGVNIEGLHLIFFFQTVFQWTWGSLIWPDCFPARSGDPSTTTSPSTTTNAGLAVPSLYVNGSLDTHETTLSWAVSTDPQIPPSQILSSTIYKTPSAKGFWDTESGQMDNPPGGTPPWQGKSQEILRGNQLSRFTRLVQEGMNLGIQFLANKVCSFLFCFPLLCFTAEWMAWGKEGEGNVKIWQTIGL